MAATIYTQTLADTTHRTLIKVVGICDASAEANTMLVRAANLSSALTANGNALLTLGDFGNAKSQYRTTIKRVWGQGAFKNKGYVLLKWRSDSNASPIVSFSDGQFDYNFDAEGLSAAIPANTAGTGDVVYSTTGVAAGDAFTLFIDLKKDGRDYDQGQTADPNAFNPQRLT